MRQATGGGGKSRSSARGGTSGTIQSRGSTVKAASEGMPLSPYASPLSPYSPVSSRGRLQGSLDRGLDSREQVMTILDGDSARGGTGELTASASDTFLSFPGTGRWPQRGGSSRDTGRGSLGLSLSGKRPIVGLDCQAEVGQKVVGVEDSPFESLGIGTITKVEGLEAGVVAVRWEKERASSRQASEYCIGHQGRYQLELAQQADLWLGERYKARGPDLFSTSRARLGDSSLTHELSGSSNNLGGDLVQSSSSKEFLKRRAGKGFRVVTQEMQGQVGKQAS